MWGSGSMNSSSPHWVPRTCWSKMWSTCITGVGRLNLFWPRRIWKMILTDGVRTPNVGRRLWQIACQWVWNLRLSLGHTMQGGELREMEWSPAQERPPRLCSSDQCSETSGSWHLARDSGRGQIPASAFTLHDEVSLRCPTGATLWLRDLRQENACTEACDLCSTTGRLSAVCSA